MWQKIIFQRELPKRSYYGNMDLPQMNRLPERDSL